MASGTLKMWRHGVWHKLARNIDRLIVHGRQGWADICIDWAGVLGDWTIVLWLIRISIAWISALYHVLYSKYGNGSEVLKFSTTLYKLGFNNSVIWFLRTLSKEGNILADESPRMIWNCIGDLDYLLSCLLCQKLQSKIFISPKTGHHHNCRGRGKKLGNVKCFLWSSSWRWLHNEEQR